ncbi:MAG: hypothetical protein JOZ25_08800, partial [Actinobacteria bacterium]|nr:hypothetical protein [Actinomycetota bacterium]
MTPVAAAEAERYFERLNDEFDAAAEVELHERDLAVANQRLRLRFASPAAAERLYPAVSHLEVPVAGGADVEFCIWDGRATGRSAPGFPWAPDDLTLRGAVRPLCDDRVHTSLEQLSGALICRHHASHRLLCWIPDAEALPWAARSSPVRSAFGWALATPSMPFVHAGCVGRDGNGVLIVGPSGSGKSTTSVACAAAGLDYASDDYLFVRIGEPVVAHSLYCTARIHDYDIERVPGLSGAVVGWVDGPGPKGVVDVRRLAPDRIRKRIQAHALVIPRPTGNSVTTMRAVGSAEALRAMAPSSILQVPQEDPRAALTALGHLARELPAYVLELGGDAMDAA